MRLSISRRGGFSHRWLALGAIVLALVAIGLDATVLSLALATLSKSLGASEAQLQWFVTSYTLALAAAMLPSGLLGDRFGRRRMLIVALVLFGAMSVACAYSTTPLEFIVARAVLGIAGACAIVMSLSVITVLFDEADRPRAMGIWAAGNFLSLPIGPIVGGYLLAHAWWGWVFLMNVPIIVIGVAAVVGFVPESRSERRPGIDYLGVLASSAGMAALMYGLVEAGDNGWGSATAIQFSLLGLAVLVGFGVWEAWLTVRPNGQPLIDLSLFRSRTFGWGVLLTAVGVFGMFGVLFTIPQYLQAVAGLDAQGTGLRFLPLILGMVCAAVPADRIVARVGPKLTVTAGLAIIAGAMLLGSEMTATTGDGFIALWTFLVGFGSGIGLATAASLAMVELSAERSGVGAALLQAVVKLGPAFGATILGSVLNATYQGRVQVAGLPAQAADAVKGSVFGGLGVAQQLGSSDLLVSVRAAFVAGMDDASRAAAIIAGVAAVVAFIVMPLRSKAPATTPATTPTSAPATTPGPDTTPAPTPAHGDAPVGV